MDSDEYIPQISQLSTFGSGGSGMMSFNDISADNFNSQQQPSAAGGNFKPPNMAEHPGMMMNPRQNWADSAGYRMGVSHSGYPPGYTQNLQFPPGYGGPNASRFPGSNAPGMQMGFNSGSQAQSQAAFAGGPNPNGYYPGQPMYESSGTAMMRPPSGYPPNYAPMAMSDQYGNASAGDYNRFPFNSAGPGGYSQSQPSPGSHMGQPYYRGHPAGYPPVRYNTGGPYGGQSFQRPPTPGGFDSAMSGDGQKPTHPAYQSHMVKQQQQTFYPPSGTAGPRMSQMSSGQQRVDMLTPPTSATSGFASPQQYNTGMANPSSGSNAPPPSQVQQEIGYYQQQLASLRQRPLTSESQQQMASIQERLNGLLRMAGPNSSPYPGNQQMYRFPNPGQMTSGPRQSGPPQILPQQQPLQELNPQKLTQPRCETPNVGGSSSEPNSSFLAAALRGGPIPTPNGVSSEKPAVSKVSHIETGS